MTELRFGGIVLEDIISDRGLVRVCERPGTLPQWAHIDALKTRLGVAVFSLARNGNRSADCRRNLMVSVPFLERQMGCLRRITPSEPTIGDPFSGLTFTPRREALPPRGLVKFGCWIRAFVTSGDESVTIVVKDVIEELLKIAEVKQQSQEAANMFWNQL